MLKNRIFIAAMALTATLGATTLVQAWDGGMVHHGMRSHNLMEHGYDQLPQQMQAIAFNQHGGGHELAPNNAAVHQQEMQNPAHRMPENVKNEIPYDQHGGGHETAPNNAAIHEKEMKDPSHKDLAQ